jgi:RimJ/RimL family protein N-acetyltransferase
MFELSQDVELSPLTRSDLEDFMTWAGDPVVTRSLTWDHYTSKEAARVFLETVAEKQPWFMAIRAQGRAVGAITLSPGAGRAACRAELGYVVARQHWGKGFATRAVKIALMRGFRELGIERIEAFVDTDNQASIQVVKKAGMENEAFLRRYVIHRGEVRDRHAYVALRSEQGVPK